MENKVYTIHLKVKYKHHTQNNTMLLNVKEIMNKLI